MLCGSPHNVFLGYEMSDEIIINVNDERNSVIGEAFLNGYTHIKGIFKNESHSTETGRTEIFMVMSKEKEKCKNNKFSCKICDYNSERPDPIEEALGICEICILSFMEDLENSYPEAYDATISVLKNRVK